MRVPGFYFGPNVFRLCEFRIAEGGDAIEARCCVMGGGGDRAEARCIKPWGFRELDGRREDQPSSRARLAAYGNEKIELGIKDLYYFHPCGVDIFHSVYLSSYSCARSRSFARPLELEAVVAKFE